MVLKKMANMNMKQSYVWYDFSSISDNIKLAVITSEDQNFINHFGFDLQAIEHDNYYNRAIDDNGTITQQVAKNLFLWSSPSFVRKGLELWISLWIEIFWPKKRILEIYLNSVEWGYGIFGIEAASYYYFNSNAKNLTLDQACLLAAILPNPYNLSAINPSDDTLKRANEIKNQIKDLNKKIYLNKLDAN